MDLARAETLARALILENAPGWGFKWDNAKTMIGRCWYAEKHISLSRILVSLRDEASIRDVILHELAHVKAGPEHGHDRRWKMYARLLGATPERCQPGPTPGRLWTGTCPGCGHTITRHRLTQVARNHYGCGNCMRGLPWNERRRFLFTWTRTAPVAGPVAASRTRRR